MKLILRIMTFVALWSLVGIIVVYVDPALIRDMGIVGLYTPMIAAVWMALVYTISWIMGISWIAIGIGSIITTILALLLIL